MSKNKTYLNRRREEPKANNRTLIKEKRDGEEEGENIMQTTDSPLTQQTVSRSTTVIVVGLKT